MNKFLFIFFFSSFIISIAKGQTIVIDPGHGYCTDKSMNYNCDDRSDLEIQTNLAVALKLKKIVTDSTKWKVYLTRETSDGWLSLGHRAKFSRDFGADIFLSIHCNAGGGSGTESFWCRKNALNAARNEQFAKTIDKKLLEICSCSSRRVVDDYSYLKNDANEYFHLTVLSKNSTVACLNELGFVDHQGDMIKLESEEMRQKFALAYYFALKEMLSTPD